MKYKLTKAEFESLGLDFQNEYKQDGDDYVLTVEGGEDTGALKRAKDHEKSARQDAEKKLKDVQDELTAKEQEVVNLRKGAVAKDDFDALEKSFNDKLTKMTAEKDAELEKANNSLSSILVDGVATKLASQISTVPELMLGYIKNRLTSDTQDGKPITRVLDAEGKPSALTVEDLQKEIVADAKFSSIIIASKGSGGGASGPGSASGGAKKFSEMSEKERVALYNESPDKYREARDAEKTE